MIYYELLVTVMSSSASYMNGQTICISFTKFSNRLSVPMYGIVLQILIIQQLWKINSQGVMCGDCSIRVFD